MYILKFSFNLKELLPVLLLAIVLAGLALYVVTKYRALEEEKFTLSTQLSEIQGDRYQLVTLLQDKEKEINSFQDQLGIISNTVGTLEKLSLTDPELLKKYSKIYFLNENYVPKTLIDIDEKYLSPGTTNFYIHAQVWPHLRALFEAAHASDLKLLTASAYRSFSTQSTLKSNYKFTYGSGANAFSADQGYSEHQLGTALDFTTEKLGANFSSFAGDGAYQWLKDNAYRYGFTLSYPENNSYYKFESWHWRFVGVELATKLHTEGKSFYDLDQREIDQYLVKLFD